MLLPATLGHPRPFAPVRTPGRLFLAPAPSVRPLGVGDLLVAFTGYQEVPVANAVMVAYNTLTPAD